MVISADWLTWFFIVYCTIPNFMIAIVYGVIQVKEWLMRGGYFGQKAVLKKFSNISHLTMIIPACNEEKVLEDTVRSILESFDQKTLDVALDILIVNDGSSDSTGQIIKKLRNELPQKIHLLERKGENSRKGKAEALNAAIKYLLKQFMPDRHPANWIIGVSDADGKYSKELFKNVLRRFKEENCDAVQCAVRIKNNYFLLTKFQDLEFLAFSKVVQKVREHIDGTVFLGGNAQFIILQKLLELHARDGFFWQKEALTEDLDISIRLHMLGAKIGFSTCEVLQEGVETLKSLFRQRKRWARGTIQAFRRYILNLNFYTSPMPFIRKTIIFYYLTFWTIPLIVGASIIIGLPLILLKNQLGIFVQNGFPLWLTLLNSFSFLPLVLIGMKTGNYSWLETIWLGALSPFYSYHWIWPVLKGCISEFGDEKVVWHKTERFSVRKITSQQGG